MVVGDWTFDSNDTVTLVSDHPTGSADPCLNVVSVAAGLATIYPTGTTINGTDITGLNSGQIEMWVKFTQAKGATGRRIGCLFRVSDAVAATFTGYYAELSYTTRGDVLIINRFSSGTRTQLQSTGLSSALSQNTWYHFRVTWTKSGSNVTVLGEVDFGSGYVAQNGGGYIDTSPNADSSSHKVGIGTFSNPANTRTDDFKVYN